MPYKTKNGQRVKVPHGATNGVQYLVKLEGTRATFECKSGGHRMTKDYGKGPPHRRLTAQWLSQRRHYWGLPKDDGTRVGHCYGWCQKCQDAWNSDTSRLMESGVVVAKVRGDE